MQNLLKYYQKLGIQPTDDLSIIKKAYRKQALRFHPDRNSTPEAHYNFIEITRAYEILTGQQELPTTGFYRPKTKEEIFAEKIKLAKERYRQQMEEEARKDAAYYRRVAFGWKWFLFKIGAAYTLIFTLLLSFDYFADGDYKTFSHYEIEHYLNSKTLVLEKERFHVDMSGFWTNPNGYPPVYATYSKLFNDLKEIHIVNQPLKNRGLGHSQLMQNFESFDNYQLYSQVSYSSMYGVFPFLHLILLIPLLLVIFKRPTLRFNIWRLVSIWIIFPLMVFLTFSNDRIFYLLGIM